MWLLLTILFVIGFFHTACNLSLLPNKHRRIIYNISIFSVVFACFQWSKLINTQDIDQFLANFGTLSTTCTFQVIEGLTMMLVSLLLIRSHYQNNKGGWLKRLAQYLALAPSGIFLVGMFLIQTYAFNVIEETPFYQIALGVAVVGFLMIWVISTLFRVLLPSWESRVEIKIILSFLQILLAMFLPIIVTGNKLLESHFVFDFTQTIITILLLMTVIFFGLYWYRYKIRRTIS